MGQPTPTLVASANNGVGGDGTFTTTSVVLQKNKIAYFVIYALFNTAPIGADPISVSGWDSVSQANVNADATRTIVGIFKRFPTANETGAINCTEASAQSWNLSRIMWAVVQFSDTDAYSTGVPDKDTGSDSAINLVVPGLPGRKPHACFGCAVVANQPSVPVIGNGSWENIVVLTDAAEEMELSIDWDAGLVQSQSWSLSASSDNAGIGVLVREGIPTPTNTPSRSWIF